MMTSDPVIDRTVGGVRVVGVSVAGIETCLAIPSYQLCFDIGRCHTGAARCRDVLISHGHVDHLGGLANHVAVRAMHRLAPSRLYGDPSLEEEVADLLRGWERRSRTPMPYAWTSVAPGEAIDLGRGLVARGLRASHRVPTLAWVVQRRETRLRPDLVGATGPEIAARVAAGEDVRVPYERIELGFSGDTRAALFDREPSLCAARVLLAECTFLDHDVL